MTPKTKAAAKAAAVRAARAAAAAAAGELADAARVPAAEIVEKLEHAAARVLATAAAIKDALRRGRP